MADLNIGINGRHYEISCDNGQEGRVIELASYIDSKLQQIARAGGAYNDAHLLVLTALVLADELFEAKEGAGMSQRASAQLTAQRPATAAAPSKDEEQAIVRVIDQLTKRIETIAAKVQAA